MKKMAAVKDWALEQGYEQIRKSTAKNPSVEMSIFPEELLKKKTDTSPKAYIFYADKETMDELKRIRQYKQFREEIKKQGFKTLKQSTENKPQTPFDWSIFDVATK
jgi:hypothetical protein